MKILFYTRAFAPLVGGLEAQTALLAEQLVARGHAITVLTTTPSAAPEGGGYRVVRQPGPAEFLRWMRWCDVYYQANVSLRGLWPSLLVRRPWVVSHHTWYRRGDGRITWRERLKRRLVSRAAGSIAVSQAIARDLGTRATVIPNAYRDDLFRILPGMRRDSDLVFVGRLVSDKGCDLLLDALAQLARRGMTPTLTIVGDGPDRDALERQTSAAGLDRQVSFLGGQSGESLVRILNRHRILVAPSRYHEPFGMVALEGIACGCWVVGSAGGGLPEAIGPGGHTFPNEDVPALAAALTVALAREDASIAPSGEVAAHLVAHSARAVAQRYEQVLVEASGRSRS